MLKLLVLKSLNNSIINMKKNNLGLVPTWNLTDFYSSIKDKQIIRDFEFIDKEIKIFSKKYLKKVNNINAPIFFEAIEHYQKISEIIGKISSYSYLIYASNLSDQINISFYQNTLEKLSKFESQIIFFTLEINDIAEEKIKKLLKDSKLKKYQPFIRDCRSFRKYQLSQDLEKFSLEKNITGRNAFIRLFDETINNLKFPFDNKNLNSQ